MTRITARIIVPVAAAAATVAAACVACTALAGAAAVDASAPVVIDGVHYPAGVTVTSDPSESTTWTKVMMTAAAADGAVCLDGSPGGFYFRKGSSNDKWLMFHQGGGWCGSPDNCADRAQTALGSSKTWGPTYTDKYEGSALFATAPFTEFNVAYLMYCDGGSWSGNSMEVVPYKGANLTLHYKGRLMLDAAIDTMLAMGMASATELLYSGCSAGGLTAYLHTDYVHSRMPASVHVVGLADAMFSLVHDNFAGVPRFPQMMAWGYEAWNSSAPGSNNDACVAAYEAKQKGSGWNCMFGANVVNYVNTPMMIVNSHYDTWQQAAILGLQCDITACNGTQEAFFIDYGHEMLTKLDAVPARHAAFLTNCPAHCQTGTGGDWAVRSVNGVPLGTAVATWYNQTMGQLKSGAREVTDAPRWVSRCDKVPCGSDVC